MKVLQVLPRLDYGGVERGTVEIAHALVQSGSNPFVVSGGGRLVSEIEKIGGVHYTLPIGSKNPLLALSCILPLKRFLQKEGIQIVHARSRVPAWIAYLATRSTSCHFLTTAHGYYRAHLLSRSIMLGEKIIAVSHPLADYLVLKFRIPSHKIIVIPRGINLNEFSSPAMQESARLREQLRIPTDAFVAGMIGRLSPVKGHPVFLKALSLLHKKNYPLYAVIVGDARGHIGYRNSIQNLVNQWHLQEFVRFTGFTENVPLYLSILDVVVVPSTVPEAFGRTALEAMAMKKAVIASAHGGILDVIQPGETGVLFPPGDTPSLADALQELFQNPEKAKKMGEAGFLRASHHFTIQQFTQKTLQVYHSLPGI